MGFGKIVSNGIQSPPSYAPLPIWPRWPDFLLYSCSVYCGQDINDFAVLYRVYIVSPDSQKALRQCQRRQLRRYRSVPRLRGRTESNARARMPPTHASLQNRLGSTRPRRSRARTLSARHTRPVGLFARSKKKLWQQPHPPRAQFESPSLPPRMREGSSATSTAPAKRG